MKKLILLLGLLSSVKLMAQPVKEVTSMADAGWYRETFTVLKSDKKVKHGPYHADTREDRLLTSGFYKDNLKDSVWQEYNYLNEVVVQGSYKNGKPVGEWSYADRWGKKENIYNFDTQQLVFHKPQATDSIENIIIQNGQQVSVRLNRQPIFLPGAEIRNRVLMHGLRYPMYAMRRGVAGNVLVAFTIDEQGHAKDYYVAKPVDPSLDAEALRCVKMIEGDWAPGLLNGKPVATIVTQRVGFNQGR